MKCGCVKVVDVNRVFHDVVTEIICFAIGLTTLDSSSRHPNAVTAGVMIPAVIIFG